MQAMEIRLGRIEDLEKEKNEKKQSKVKYKKSILEAFYQNKNKTIECDGKDITKILKTLSK